MSRDNLLMLAVPESRTWCANCIYRWGFWSLSCWTCRGIACILYNI